MNIKSKWISLLCVIALLFSFSACGTNNDSSKTDSTNAQDTQITDEQTGKQTSYPLTVTDAYGNDVIITEEPTRIISVSPSITENLFAIDAGDLLVGRTDYCDYPQEVSAITSVGAIDSPSMETIVELEPDLVIASSIFTEDSYEQITDLGIPVVILTDATDIYGVYTMLETLGEITNHSEETTEVISQMVASISDTQEKITGLEKPSVYYVLGYGEYGDYTAGGDTFVGNIIELAGGDNIAKDVSGWSYSLESLIEADPDIIILPEGMKADFIASPNYSSLSAVVNDQVYEIDQNQLERQGARNADAVLALAGIFYPDVFS